MTIRGGSDVAGRMALKVVLNEVDTGVELDVEALEDREWAFVNTWMIKGLTHDARLKADELLS